MAQLKRLTRKQKMLLSRIKSNLSINTADPNDLSALEKHGLITLDLGVWTVTTKGKEFSDGCAG